MCTAISFRAEDFYFGRTLDYDCMFQSEVVVMPRNYPLRFRFLEEMPHHYALCGMAYIRDGVPLFYDGMNEKGLAVAALSFGEDIVYSEESIGIQNIASFEVIPYILAACKSAREAKEQLKSAVITDTPFDSELPPSPLHWIFADGRECFVAEYSKEGMNIYDDCFGILTNAPAFPFQKENLNDYMGVSAKVEENRFCVDLPLQRYSRGMGGIGLPGDFSSRSRFVRGTFLKFNSCPEGDDRVGEVFSLLSGVSIPKGAVVLEEERYHRTLYTSCMNVSRGEYYYTTCTNRRINGVRMMEEDLSAEKLSLFPLELTQSINYQN